MTVRDAMLVAGGVLLAQLVRWIVVTISGTVVLLLERRRQARNLREYVAVHGEPENYVARAMAEEFGAPCRVARDGGR